MSEPLKKRPKELGYLFVVGGPGGSGASTISVELAKRFNLKRIYAGELMRNIARVHGYEELVDFFKSEYFQKNSLEIDSQVDQECVRSSQLPNILIDSKAFAAIAQLKQIPCTVKIWLDADLSVRTLRTLGKDGAKQLGGTVTEESPQFKETFSVLKARYDADCSRFDRLYNIDYSSPEKYNDIVIDTSLLNEVQTMELILNRLEDGGYLK